MEQHAVPQQISAYSFKLVGDMTLKQFIQLAGGALVSLLIYSTNLPGFIKWPLVFLFTLAGAAMAFLPFEERPLEEWVVAFFRSIYSPTLFKWTGRTDPSAYFAAEGSQIQQTPSQEPQIQNQKQENTGQSAVVITQLDEAEKAFLSKVTQMFHAPAQQNLQSVQNPTGQTQIINQTVPSSKTDVRAETTPTTIPQSKPQSLPQKQENTVFQSNVKEERVEETLTSQTSQNAQQAQFSSEAAPPMPPTQPNVIVGQTMDPEGKIVEGAILEIKDENGRPVRALRTNKVGHFMIVTPLADGSYQLIAEKQGMKFEPVSFEAKGEIIQPIAVRASEFKQENTNENTNI